MPTGACGINCDVCKLRLLGTCSSCGSGKSFEAHKKLAAQERIFGAVCTILKCACMKHVEYCLRDCTGFPCSSFKRGPYPFSEGFMGMQDRRRKQIPPAFTHHGTLITVPAEYWETLLEKDINTLCNLTLSEKWSNGLVFRFLNEDIRIDIQKKRLLYKKEGAWQKTEDPLLELVTLLYMNKVDSFHPIGKDIVSTKDLKEAHFFKKEHELKTAPLLERYSDDINGFIEAAEYLAGKPMDMADAAYMLLPFPRVPIYYLFWQGDDEFKTRISILFDRSIEDSFSAAAIWGLVNRVSIELLKGPRTLM